MLRAFRTYQLPIIELKKGTTKEAVCLVFEKVNTGGVPLSVFELVTVSYAADGYNLRDDWYGSALRNVISRHKRLAAEPLLAAVGATDFLQAITMLETLKQRRADSPMVLVWRPRRIIPTALDTDTRPPMGPSGGIPLCESQQPGRLVLYGGAVETRVANDAEELLNWIDKDGDPPRTVSDAAFNPDGLDRLSSRLSAAYKGLNLIVLREGAKDLWVFRDSCGWFGGS